VEIIVKGLSKQRTAATETRDAAARSNFNSVERNYVKKCIRGIRGLFGPSHGAADYGGRGRRRRAGT
jgi:hypothetical protein